MLGQDHFDLSFERLIFGWQLGLVVERTAAHSQTLGAFCHGRHLGEWLIMTGEHQLTDLPRASLTVDNGTEHARHEEITKRLTMPIYFAHAYCSGEKGAVENTNGLLRRYLPRGKSIQDVTQEDLDDIAWELNNRPRKILGYFTPQEMLDSELVQCEPVAIAI